VLDSITSGGAELLWEVDGIGRRLGWRHGIAQAMAERGYVDFLRARYDRAEVALTGALELAEGSSALSARAAIYLAGVASDRADYPRAFDLVDLGLKHARIAGDARREAYAHCLLGRVHLLTGEFDDAAAMLEESRAMAERERWLAFLPWPQALRADVQLARGDVTGAHAMVRQAFARACQLGDPCWEGFAARGLVSTRRAFLLFWRTGILPRGPSGSPARRQASSTSSSNSGWLSASLRQQRTLGRR